MVWRRNGSVHHGALRREPCESSVPCERVLFERLVAETASDSERRLSLPHVVFVHDPYLDLASVFGPFEDPLAAASFAERYVAELVYGTYRQPVSATVVALEPVDDVERV